MLSCPVCVWLLNILWPWEEKIKDKSQFAEDAFSSNAGVPKMEGNLIVGAVNEPLNYHPENLHHDTMLQKMINVFIV